MIRSSKVTGRLKLAALSVVAAVGLSGCGFSPYDIPLPGGADTGDQPITVTAEFRDVLDLVPQSGVRVNDIAVGKVKDIRLNGWTAVVTLEINRDAKLPDNAVASIRQTSLLGEKFVSLAPPETGATGTLKTGDKIPLDRSGRNPEIEEVLSAASLLLNGGGIDRTNTIVKEVNNALGGNEAEVRELLDTTTQFVGQLDDNKQDIITSLEKVDRLAVATNKQRGAITGALDTLPGALRVLNDQRDDMVKLLQALDRLGDVATGVVRQSRADTVADLKLLTPTLTNLAKSSDDLAYDLKALATFPFTDGAAGGTPAKALGTCTNDEGTDNTGYCPGDFANLNVNVDIDAKQIEGVLGALGLDLGALDDAAQGDPQAEAADPGADVPGMSELQEALDGVNLPGLGNLLQPQSQPSTRPQPGKATPKPAPTPTSGGGGVLCGLFGNCRTSVASASDLRGTETGGAEGLASIMLQPAVNP